MFILLAQLDQLKAYQSLMVQKRGGLRLDQTSKGCAAKRLVQVTATGEECKQEVTVRTVTPVDKFNCLTLAIIDVTVPEFGRGDSVQYLWMQDLTLHVYTCSSAILFAELQTTEYQETSCIASSACRQLQGCVLISPMHQD